MNAFFSYFPLGNWRARVCQMVALTLLLASTTNLSTRGLVAAADLDFRGQELPTRLTVGYAVRLLDMNQDQRLDIVVVDSKRILWLENPNWQEHVMFEDQSQPFDNVCFAPYDIDGDGQLDFAIGADWQFNNTKSGGTIGWISPGPTPLGPWQYHRIGDEPTVHRIQFADIDGDQRAELIVAPLKGRNTTGPEFSEAGVRLLAYEIPESPTEQRWESTLITDELHVMHNFWPTRLGDATSTQLLTASFEGVNLLSRTAAGSWQRQHLGTGNQTSRPNRGASEIKNGKLADGQDYIATIEPWHGHEVVVYNRPPEGSGKSTKWTRHVLDDELKWGHAVWCANLDDDPAEELIIGVRDDLSPTHRRGLRIYDPPSTGGAEWTRQSVDPGSVAIEDLAAGDLNEDGRVDVVAVGRQTHNIKIYWNETK